MNLFSKIELTNSSFLQQAERLFASEPEGYNNVLSGIFADYSIYALSHFTVSDSAYPYCEFLATYIGGMDRESIIKYYDSVLSSIRAIKRDLLKNLRRGTFDADIASGEIKTAKVERWLADPEQLFLVDFALYESRRPSTKLKYSLYQLCYLFLSEAKNVSSRSNFAYPADLAEHPFFALSARSSSPQYSINLDTNNLEFYYIKETEDSRMRVKVGDVPFLPNMTEDDIDKLARSFIAGRNFDIFDQVLYTFLLNSITPSVFSTREFLFHVDEFADFINRYAENAVSKELCSSRQALCVSIRNSLLKFWKYRVEIKTESVSGKITESPAMKAANVFLNKFEIGDRNNPIHGLKNSAYMVSVVFEADFLDDWFHDVTEKVFVATSDYLKLSMDAKAFAFYLQKKRIEALTAEEPSLSTSLNIMNLFHVFPGKKKADFLTTFETVLDEYISYGIMITKKEYSKDNADIIFTWKPLSDAERKTYNAA